ncbi:MAG: DUF4397 domain-containing protein [Gammaproteobacteria bacterium]|nr:DUF4397 domain-containing protein [Gammaproteobacteria bacterium]
MQKTLRPIIVLLTLLTAACGGDPNLPEATGKGSIRAINAIPMSSDINFLIEERRLSTLVYHGASSPVSYDDLNYTFNFEVLYAGESSTRRIASRNIDVVANRDYVFLLGGSLSSPTLTLWEDDERTFAETDTVLAVKFAHASATLGALDYYFADATVAPAVGNQAATLSFGEVADAVDYAEGDYVLTITTAGNPADVIYTSESNTFTPRDTYLLTAFDGDERDRAPMVVNSFRRIGGSSQLPDANFAPTVQFVNASMDLGTVDIYDDEALTSQVIAAHDFLDVTAEVEIAEGTNTFYYTPAGDTAAVLLEVPLSAFPGRRYRALALGPAGEPLGVPFPPDVRSVGTGAKLSLYSSSNNVTFIDIYAVEADTSIDDASPLRSGLAIDAESTTAALAAGSYDLYVTEFGEKVALAGPYRLDVAIGDVVDLIVVDTMDPTVLDVLFLSGGPTP